MLHQEFPDTWRNIVKAADITRRMYDQYEYELNQMLESVASASPVTGGRFLAPGFRQPVSARYPAA